MLGRVRKAVFPAAGLGTRFLPATKAQPKEMLPLVDKPIIQYVIEEAVAAGLTNIIIVTGRGKNAIEDHFDVSYELERLLQERGKTDLLDQVRAVSNMINVSYVRQGEALGWGTRCWWRATSWATSPSRSCSGTTSSTARRPA
jgi:UTP--glucose-1-phosphate uridylyltransferase